MSLSEALEIGTKSFEVKRCVYAQVDRTNCALRFNHHRCGRDVAECSAERAEVLRPRGCKHELLMQTLKQRYAQTFLECFYLLAYRSWGYMQFVRSKFEAQMPGRGFKSAKCI